MNYIVPIKLHLVEYVWHLQVNEREECIFEAFCQRPEETEDVPMRHNYIPPEQAKARHPVEVVQQRVRALLSSNVQVVGFDVKQDLLMLKLELPPVRVIDIQKHYDALGC